MVGGCLYGEVLFIIQLAIWLELFYFLVINGIDLERGNI